MTLNRPCCWLWSCPLSSLHSFLPDGVSARSPMNRWSCDVHVSAVNLSLLSTDVSLFLTFAGCSWAYLQKKNNKVTKNELLNLQPLFTLIIFLAWGGWYILQEAGELLGYLLWDFALNLSQACFNCLEVHQKCTWASSGFIYAFHIIMFYPFV